MEAIGYIRKSTKDQSRYSLKHQKNAIREYCKNNQIELGEVYTGKRESHYIFDKLK